MLIRVHPLLFQRSLDNPPDTRSIIALLKMFTYNKSLGCVKSLWFSLQ